MADSVPALEFDPRVDAYIEAAADFAQPVLQHLREQMHQACPDVRETMNWSMPFFVTAGRNLAFMAAFKAHCGFGFWHGDAVTGKDKGGGIGQFGRLTRIADLPKPAELRQLIKKATALNAAGAKPARLARPAAQKAAPVIPEDLASALAVNEEASRHFSAMATSHQREYIDWIVDAKREETRHKRLTQAIEWLSEGKSRNWKYERR